MVRTTLVVLAMATALAPRAEASCWDRIAKIFGFGPDPLADLPPAVAALVRANADRDRHGSITGAWWPTPAYQCRTRRDAHLERLYLNGDDYSHCWTMYSQRAVAPDGRHLDGVREFFDPFRQDLLTYVTRLVEDGDAVHSRTIAVLPLGLSEEAVRVLVETERHLARLRQEPADAPWLILRRKLSEDERLALHRIRVVADANLRFTGDTKARLERALESATGPERRRLVARLHQMGQLEADARRFRDVEIPPNAAADLIYAGPGAPPIPPGVRLVPLAETHRFPRLAWHRTDASPFGYEMVRITEAEGLPGHYVIDSLEARDRKPVLSEAELRSGGFFVAP